MTGLHINEKVRLERFVYILVDHKWPRKFKFLNVGNKVYLPVNFDRKKLIFKKSHTNANHNDRFYANCQFNF